MDYIECLSILLQLDSVVNESTYLLNLDQFKLTSFFLDSQKDHLQFLNFHFFAPPPLPSSPKRAWAQSVKDRLTWTLLIWHRIKDPLTWNQLIKTRLAWTWYLSTDKESSIDEGSTDKTPSDMPSKPTARSDLHWKEDPPGTWSRSLDATEAHFISMASTAEPYGREFGFLTIVMKIDFGGVDPIDSTRNAWLAGRLKYPLLASSIDGDKRVYHTASDLEIQSWLEETFITYPQRSSDQRAQQLRLDLRPTKRAQLHVLPQSQETLLHTGHDVLDGQSMLFFVNSLLEEIRNPSQDLAFGGEAANLPPPLSLAVNITPATSTQGTQV